MNRTIAISATVLGLGLSLIGCGTRPDPCTTLAAPTQAEISAAASGAEIEREVEDSDGNEVECELVGGTWQEEQDSE